MKLHPNEIVLDQHNIIPLMEYVLSKSKGHLRALHTQIHRQQFGKGQSIYDSGLVDEDGVKRLFPDLI